MKIEISNQQRIKRVNLKKTKTYLRKIFTRLNISSKKISIVFCDNGFIKKLNRRFFKKNYSTDVISFNLSDEFDPDYLGEVVVSVEKAVKVAKKRNCKWESELMLYLVHGVLHLIGYDDASRKNRLRMNKKEAEIMEDIFGPQPTAFFK